jgi:hypothetical protein
MYPVHCLSVIANETTRRFLFRLNNNPAHAFLSAAFDGVPSRPFRISA